LLSIDSNTLAAYGFIADLRNVARVSAAKTEVVKTANKMDGINRFNSISPQ